MYTHEYKNEKKIKKEIKQKWEKYQKDKQKFIEEEDIYFVKVAKYREIRWNNDLFDKKFNSFNNYTNMSLNKNNMNNIINFYQEINLINNMCGKNLCILYILFLFL